MKTREVSLDMGTGMGMDGMMMGGGGFAINGHPFDTTRIDFALSQSTVERWHIRSTIVAHPFHCHIPAHEDAGMMGQFTVS